MSMNKEEYLYRIDRIAGFVLRADVCVMAVMLVLLCFGLSCRLLWMICGGVFAAAVLCRIFLAPFVKSEEEEDFEKKIAYVLSQKMRPKDSKPSIPSDYSPLRNLSPEQEEKIIQLLRELPAHHTKPDQINLALIAQYLTALERLGKARITDKHALRLWVEQVTGKKTPDSNHFNEAIPSTTDSKVLAAQKEIERILQ